MKFLKRIKAIWTMGRKLEEEEVLRRLKLLYSISRHFTDYASWRDEPHLISISLEDYHEVCSAEETLLKHLPEIKQQLEEK